MKKRIIIFLSCCMAFLAIGATKYEWNKTVVRAAFDVGSGITKMTVAKVDKSTGTPLEVLYSGLTPVFYNDDYKHNKSGQLSEKILDEGKEALEEFKEIAQGLGANEMAGVATAVFRESSNGNDFIDKVRDDLGINLQVISQQEEGEIGFFTAVAKSGGNEEKVVSWDSGGSSFQIAMKDGKRIKVFEGPWGSTKVIKEMDKISPSSTPTIEQVNQLKKIIQEKLPPLPFQIFKKINTYDTRVIAIGGEYSIFNTGVLATGKSDYSKEDIMKAIDAYIQSNGQSFDPISLKKTALAELVFLYSVMDYFEMGNIQYEKTNGSTMGVLTYSKLWEPKEAYIFEKTA